MSPRGPKPWILELEPYQPGKPVEELEREFGITGSVKLASNENPIGPSPKAIAAIREAADQAHRYPDGASFELRRTLAARLGVPEGQLVFGTGSDELLELLAKAYLGPGDELLYAWPSFAMYPIVAQGMGARGVGVPLDGGLVHDLDAILAAVNDATQLVIVCNPNNPTGTSVGAEALDRFADALPEDVVLVIDEAYIEYARRADFPDSIGLVRRRPNTVALRTFSKDYGLAGLRVGYAFADAPIADVLERARHPFNLNLLAQAAACAALADDEHLARSRETNARGIVQLEQGFEALGVESWPTDANFVLARTGTGTYEALLPLGVIVRPMAGAGLPDCVRVTVGTADENEKFLKALAQVRAGGDAR